MPTRSKILSGIVIIVCLAVPSIGLAISSDDSSPAVASAKQDALAMLQRGQRVQAGQEAAPPMPTSVPSDLLDTFSAFQRPIAAKRTAAVDTVASSGMIAASLSPNKALTRAVPSPDGTQQWYVVPANDGLCIVIGDDGSCVSLALAKAQGLMTMQTPAVPLKVANGKAAGPVPLSAITPEHFMGIVPSGLTSVRALNDDGSSSSTGKVTSDGLFDITSKNVAALAFDGPGKATMTVRYR